MEEKNGIFAKLNAINVNGHTEKKGGLTYLSWTWAWSEVKKNYPEAKYEVERFDGKPYLYDPDLGYMCFTKVTIGEETNEMWLPVMDSTNRAMKAEPYSYKVWDKGEKKYVDKIVSAATMFDINKTIMRCLVKNLAMFGLGLYIYSGEELTEEETAMKIEAEKEQADELEHILNCAIQEIKATSSRDTLNSIYSNYKATLGNNQKFISALNSRAAELGIKRKGA